MTSFLDHINDRVLVCDGAMGSLLHGMGLDVEKDYLGKENCNEVLNLSRPDVIRKAHAMYFEAGVDIVETNSFCGAPVSLEEFGLADKAFEINKRAAEIAREAAEQFSDGRKRFVMGSVGPGTKLPTLAHIEYDELEKSYLEQCKGLAEGGVDLFLVETTQDVLQIKSAVNAAKKAAENKNIPVFVQITLETTGTMLVGADIASAATAIHALDVPSMGINCATGPQEMAVHVKWLSENWPRFISIQPNAGMPEMVDGQTHFPLKPEELAYWHEKFITQYGINIAGGCCGTTPAHLNAVDKMVRKISSDKYRLSPVKRSVHWIPSVASLYNQVSYEQENSFLSIGERCNANGSKKFRELLAAEDWDSIVEIGKEQVKAGSNTLDVCVAVVGRDEISDMKEVVSRMRGAVNTPLVFDSTDTKVLEEALKLYAGKGIINSINLEEGDEVASERLDLAKKFGAGVIALTIDEKGMAKETSEKLEIARRLYKLACEDKKLAPADLLFDPLTFTICTGNEDDRKLGIKTLDAIEQISKEMPECQIVLGLSNISFGLRPAARHVLNTIFLDEAVKRGLTSAIVHVSKILPMNRISNDEIKTALDLIYDRRSEGYDPLHKFIELFENRTAKDLKTSKMPETVEEQIKQCVVDGNKKAITESLEKALEKYSPVEIINELLLGGMKVVGELFGSGKMQLPFVLQSAETMKTAVSYLEPFMDKDNEQEKAKMVLATVKGDVHDIGKNLVDIILSNNGYKVVNIGIKQTAEEIIKAIKEHKPDAVGMSGLLVKSTVEMKNNLEVMASEGIDIPVLLGGAALNRKYVEQDCRQAYGCDRVSYAKDAFAALEIMEHITNGTIDEFCSKGDTPKVKTEPKVTIKPIIDWHVERQIDYENIQTVKTELAKNIKVPEAPFFGSKIIDNVSIKALLPYLNETMLFYHHWGFKRPTGTDADKKAFENENIRPVYKRMLELCEKEQIITPKAVYGFWRCASEENSLKVFAEDNSTLAEFDFPRQNKENGICIADFYRDVSAGEKDVVGFQIVTAGAKASEVEKEWVAEDRYQDYLFLHGLSVELAEAMAEYVHKRIRSDLGYVNEDAEDIKKILKQGYRGSRYSFGYPACPDISQQHKILELLKADRIGIKMLSGDMLEPEQSTSAIVSHHPQAKYFVV